MSVETDIKYVSQDSFQSNSNRVACHICSGLMHKTDLVVQKIRNSLSDDYHFNTFLIGVTLPSSLYEKEDQIRARFKIRGRENIKSQLVRDLRKKFRKYTNKQIDFSYPDVTVNLQFRKESELGIDIQKRSMIIFGRYIKKNRGIPQRAGGLYKSHTQSNTSLTVNSSSPHGSTICSIEDTSIQSLISKEILGITRGQALKFSWIGSEDKNSLVLGSGRPFVVQVRNPKTLHLNVNKLDFPRYGLSVNLESLSKKLSEQPVQFIAKTRIIIQTPRQLVKEEVLKIRSLTNSVISFRNQKKLHRTSTKRIYSLDVVKQDNRICELYLVADGGLTIKQFVEGRECINPNVSTVVNLRCECLMFDVLDIVINKYQ
jgi:tRNA pseudouridine synthase 10